MTMTNLLIAVAMSYVCVLFIVAFVADRIAQRSDAKWLRSRWIYTLSLSIYCTAWTFYGAVGLAARNGLEYVTIYLGPTLIMLGWWGLLRRIVSVGRTERATSIADLISSRYGKSNLLAVMITLIAVIGTTPYIALQMQSLTLSFATFVAYDPEAGNLRAFQDYTALWVSAGLTVFTVLFGTRNLDANERHYGVVMAIAFEAIVKLLALLTIGIFVVWQLGDGAADMFHRINTSSIAAWEVKGTRWVSLILLSGAAFLCLPRMFQVMVVENADEGHLRTASWAFPAYLLLISLFVIPIAITGLERLPGDNPDLYVLTLPLSEGRYGLAILAFLGGFSAATSMVIVATIALSTMVSNQIVIPFWLWLTGGTALVAGDLRRVALMTRRIAIGGILFLGYLYFRLSGGGSSLAVIGLISFTGVAQFLPPLLGALLWRGASLAGAASGLLGGFVIWLYCLFLPSFGPNGVLPQHIFDNGLFGFSWLRPQALFWSEGLDAVPHALLWSMLINAGLFIAGSIIMPNRAPRAHVDTSLPYLTGQTMRDTDSEYLLLMTQRIIGPADAQRFFAEAAAAQGLSGYLPDPTTEFLTALERKLAGSVGAATAHAMILQGTGGRNVSVEALIAMADETVQIMEHSSQLEAQSRELARTARQLRAANAKLTQISEQKDEFLSQVSHELRTPMTSIRSFSEILRDADDLDPAMRNQYASIIHDESVRLSRLLNNLLDLNVLEGGHATLDLQPVLLKKLLDQAVMASGVQGSPLQVIRLPEREQITLTTDTDRLQQVFINLIANARKYCDADPPVLRISVRNAPTHLVIDFVDNGSGIAADQREMIFEKFARVPGSDAQGAGLGLTICREIMHRLGGTISYLPGQGGAAFRVALKHHSD